ncbi:DEN2D protein, partial [Jacana jacana]|nr:DEN2D protein [Jacana jacana]
ASIGNFFRRSLRRSRRREVKEDEGKKESNPSRVPQGKPGERSSVFYSAGQFFFEYLVVVSLKKMTDGHYEPKITYQFPKRENLLKGQKEEEERLLKAIPLFCFPDGNNWAPVTEFTSETFSFVLTNVDGSRKIGYCRRLLPSGRGVRLPEVFCIISCLGCFGLFSKILDEVEKRRQISMAVIYPFMQGLRESPFPAPGKTVTIKSFIPESGTEVEEWTGHLKIHFWAILARASSPRAAFEEVFVAFISKSCTLISPPFPGQRSVLLLTEEGWHWVDFKVLSNPNHSSHCICLVVSWRSRRCALGIPLPASLQHPAGIIKSPLIKAPLMGCTNRFPWPSEPGSYHSQLLHCPVAFQVGDEEEILPIKLQTEMLASLNRHNNNNNVHTSEQVNTVVSEAFVQFFVRMVGHYPSHIKWSKHGSGTFQERAFCKAIASKTNRKFVKKFVKTNMFSLFIEEAEKSRIPQEGK